ncbi:MAG: hypothetical protein HPY64_05705 [Anaerolineae bacterium]|nr:hypothetical protein [Anaerolineae bacterium]
MKLTATYIERRAATVDLPYPDVAPAHLKLEVPLGRVNLQPGGGTSLISGKVTYNVAELKPTYSVHNRTVTIRQKFQMLIPTGQVINDWEFLLGTAHPYSLDVSIGAAEADVDLGGVPLTGFKLASGAGDMTVDFALPNPTRLIDGRINTGAGRTTLKNLLNANAEYLKIGAGVGQVVAKFTGDGLTGSGRVRLEGGLGEIVLVLEEDAPIRVNASVGLGGISADDDLIRMGKSYQTAAYDASDVRLDIDVSGGVGAIRIELV